MLVNTTADMRHDLSPLAMCLYLEKSNLLQRDSAARQQGTLF